MATLPRHEPTHASSEESNQRPAAHLTAGISLLVAAAVLIVAVIADPRDPVVQAADDSLRQVLDPGSSETAVSLAKAITTLGNWPWPYLLLALVTVLLAMRRRWRHAAYVAVAVTATSLLVIPALKEIVGRTRPPDHLVEVSSYAFPSGHAGYAAIIGAALALASTNNRRRWLVVAVIFTLAMMWSRMYLSVHWLSDTVAAALIGFGIAFMLSWLTTPWLITHADRPKS